MTLHQSPRDQVEPPSDGTVPARGRWTRPASYAALVAACAVVVAVPFLVVGHHRTSDAVGSDRSRSVPARGTLVGDVDGDGRPDEIRVRDQAVVLDLAADPGHPVTRQLGLDSRLVGLADVGADGRAVVTSVPSRTGMKGRDWTVRLLEGGRLRAVHTHGGQMLGSEPGSLTTWVADDGRLLTGSLDPVQEGSRRRAVRVARWTLSRATGGATLTAAPVGRWCWDTRTEQHPRPCAPGESDAADMGPVGDLPRLLPARTPASIRVGQSFRHGPDTYALVPGPPSSTEEDQSANLVEHLGTVTLDADVPKGWSPVVFELPLDLGVGEGPAVVTSQEGGDSDTWRVWLPWHGALTQLATDGPFALGGGFLANGATAYLTWIGPDGDLFTRVGTDQATHYRVYRWGLVDGDAQSPPHLAADDLGVVCLDLVQGTYGTCPG